MATARFQIQVAGGGYGTAGVEAYASAGDAIDCRLESIEGVDSVAWSFTGNHSSAATEPTITLSGYPVGQIASFTLPAGVGQAWGITCKVNGGAASTQNALHTSKSAVRVAYTNGNYPVFVGESFEASATHATVPKFNALLAADGASATDTNAIHDNVSGEISAVTLKATPVSNDLLLIEDSAASNAKKRVTAQSIANLASSTDANAIHDNVSGEISSITSKTPVGADLLLVEDSAASNAKKKITVQNIVDLAAAIDTTSFFDLDEVDPTDFSGASAGQVVRVNAGEDGLEFGDVAVSQAVRGCLLAEGVSVSLSSTSFTEIAPTGMALSGDEVGMNEPANGRLANNSGATVNGRVHCQFSVRGLNSGTNVGEFRLLKNGITTISSTVQVGIGTNTDSEFRQVTVVSVGVVSLANGDYVSVWGRKVNAGGTNNIHVESVVLQFQAGPHL